MHTFGIIQIKILDNIGPVRFISWELSMKLSGYRSIFSCPSTRVPSLVEKYKKITYVIFDGTPFAVNLCDGTFKLLNQLQQNLGILRKLDSTKTKLLLSFKHSEQYNFLNGRHTFMIFRTHTCYFHSYWLKESHSNPKE
jgi:hypothetical protein